MKKVQLMEYVGKNVHICFKDGGKDVCGTLGYVDEFSEKHDFRKVDYFYVGNILFKTSHVRKVIERW